MKVSELINILNQYDPELPVVIDVNCDDSYFDYLGDIKEENINRFVDELWINIEP